LNASRNEARRIAANIAKVAELLRRASSPLWPKNNTLSQKTFLYDQGGGKRWGDSGAPASS